jgi:hypothetical protein
MRKQPGVLRLLYGAGLRRELPNTSDKDITKAARGSVRALSKIFISKFSNPF